MLGEVAVTPGATSLDQFVVVVGDVKGAAALGRGAQACEGAPATAGPEGGIPLGRDDHRLTSGAGGGASGVVDDEVVAVEAAGDRRSQRHRLDGLVVAGLAQGGPDLARAVGGVGQDLSARFLAVEQFDDAAPAGQRQTAEKLRSDGDRRSGAVPSSAVFEAPSAGG